MGLTIQSTQSGTLQQEVDAQTDCKGRVLALAGNPNVGKSTVFNALTGLRQHTGNWPGKTVANAQGTYLHDDITYTLVDLPGTYSIMSSSAEEEIARDYICFGNTQATIVVADATCLERNLNLILQILEITPNCVLCINLMDQAAKKKIRINIDKLSELLQIPVIPVSALHKKGLDDLTQTAAQLCEHPNPQAYCVPYDSLIEQSIANVCAVLEETVGDCRLPRRFMAVKLLGYEPSIVQSMERHLGISLLENEAIAQTIAQERAALAEYGITEANFADKTVCSMVSAAERLANACVVYENTHYDSFDRRIDRVLTSKIWGIPAMLLLLGIVFYITMAGANYPSQWLSAFFQWVQGYLTLGFQAIHAPDWLYNMLVLGMYQTLTWVVSVMLPPMAIFFPLFTLLEDVGYLPRVAFNLDHVFQKCHAHGKQCLTMCMGLGCNCAGVIGARIIDSPRERLIAILTNNFVPCNGRFPTLIALSAIFIGAGLSGGAQSAVSTIAIVLVILLGICMTLLTSKLLSCTILKGRPSHFTLELPPYRKPKIWEVIYRSVFDRTLFVLGRAVAVAAPAGILIWCMANIHIGNLSLLAHCAGFLDPFARWFGLDGYILMAFLLGIPANEIVLPIIMMSYMATGSLVDASSTAVMGNLFIQNGWTVVTAICVMLFSLMHYPCATALLTIKKETQSWKWTAVAFALPTAAGLLCCFVVAQAARLLGIG